MTAVLRKESGATIQPSEFNTADEQYFPIEGDSSEVVAQKRMNRETVVRELLAGRGSGGGPKDGEKGEETPEQRKARLIKELSEAK